MPPKFAKLAGLGAFGAIGFFVLLFVFVAWLAMPTPSGGIDAIEATVAWISLGCAVLALAGVHVVIGRQLLALSRQPAADVTHAAESVGRRGATGAR